jgi:RNA polymerase sigma-70 factor (ECF subfamily)
MITSGLDPVQRAKRGDREAFGEVFDLYVDRVYEYLAHQLEGQPQLAQDLTEDVFVEALRRRREWPHEGLTAWLYGVANRRLSSRVFA